jgi:hypothetical protein
MDARYGRRPVRTKHGSLTSPKEHPMAKISMTKAEDTWRVERDLETMLECERIEKDPKRIAAAQKLAKERVMTLAKVASEGTDD